MLGLVVARTGAALAAGAGAIVMGAATLAAGAPCDAETVYHCARVEEDPGGRAGACCGSSASATRTSTSQDPTHLEFDYTQWMGDAIDDMPAGPLEAVFIGGGGFTLPRYVAATRPGSRSRVLEVDGDLVELARERLGLRTGPDLRVRVGDARADAARASRPTRPTSWSATRSAASPCRGT